jgi:hypothetical protein
MTSLLHLPLELLKELSHFCGCHIYEFRNLCTYMRKYVPRPLILAYTAISEEDINNFASIFIRDGKQSNNFNDVIFNITTLYGINPVKLFDVFNCVKINKFFVFGRKGGIVIEDSQDMVEEIKVSRCKFPPSEITIFFDMIVGETYLRRVNSFALVIRDCDLTVVGLNYLPSLKVTKLEITNLKRIKQFTCSISDYLQELTIDDTIFTRYMLFNACRSNLKILSFPACADSYDYIRLFPDSLKTIYIHNCEEYIEEYVIELLNADAELYITEIATVYGYIEKIHSTRYISDVEITDTIFQYLLVKDDMYIYIIR